MLTYIAFNVIAVNANAIYVIMICENNLALFFTAITIASLKTILGTSGFFQNLPLAKFMLMIAGCKPTQNYNNNRNQKNKFLHCSSP
jgi:hypothetical protein